MLIVRNSSTPPGIVTDGSTGRQDGKRGPAHPYDRTVNLQAAWRNPIHSHSSAGTLSLPEPIS